MALDGLSFSVQGGSGLSVSLARTALDYTTMMRADLLDLPTSTPATSGGTVSIKSISPPDVGSGTCRRSAGLYPRMPVGDQVEYIGRLHGLSAPTPPATKMWLERSGCRRAASKVESLSHGNQQRVQLAAALVHDPELLVLDEPLSGLDPAGIDAIGDVLVDACSGRLCRAVLQPSTRPGRGHVRVGDDHRPRQAGHQRPR